MNSRTESEVRNDFARLVCILSAITDTLVLPNRGREHLAPQSIDAMRRIWEYLNNKAIPAVSNELTKVKEQNAGKVVLPSLTDAKRELTIEVSPGAYLLIEETQVTASGTLQPLIGRMRGDNRMTGLEDFEASTGGALYGHPIDREGLYLINTGWMEWTYVAVMPGHGVIHLTEAQALELDGMCHDDPNTPLHKLLPAPAYRRYPNV